MFISSHFSYSNKARISDADPQKIKEALHKKHTFPLGATIFLTSLIILDIISVIHVFTSDVMHSPSILGVLYIILWGSSIAAIIALFAEGSSREKTLQILMNAFHKPTRIKNYISKEGIDLDIRNRDYSTSLHSNHNELFFDYVKSLPADELVRVIENKLELLRLNNNNKKILKLLGEETVDLTKELENKLVSNSQRIDELKSAEETFNKKFVNICEQQEKSEKQKEVLNILAS